MGTKICSCKLTACMTSSPRICGEDPWYHPIYHLRQKLWTSSLAIVAIGDFGLIQWNSGIRIDVHSRWRKVKDVNKTDPRCAAKATALLSQIAKFMFAPWTLLSMIGMCSSSNNWCGMIRSIGLNLYAWYLNTSLMFSNIATHVLW